MEEDQEYLKLKAARSASQGAVTRQVNSIGRIILLDDKDRDGIAEGPMQKLEEAKARYDSRHEALHMYCSEKGYECEPLEASAAEVDTMVTDTLIDVKRWMKKGRDDAELASLSAVEKVLESERQKRTEERLDMTNLIDNLTRELAELKAGRGTSTPSTSPNRRVTFGLSDTFSAAASSAGPIRARFPADDWRYGSERRPGGTPNASFSVGRGRGLGRGRTSLSATTSGSSSVMGDMSVAEQVLHQTLVNQTSILASLKTPAVTLPKYDGNPLEYTSFITAYKELVYDSEDSDRAKLMCLMSNCIGRAECALRGCGHMEATLGLKSALDILKAKFGSPFMISQAWLRKILDYPSLNDAESLDNFASDLQSCCNSMQTLGKLYELECTSTIGQIIAKLPMHVRVRWRKEHRRYQATGEGSQLELLVRIINEAADDAMDPAYGETAIAKIRSTYSGSGVPSSRPSRLPVGGVRRGAVNLASDTWHESVSDEESYESEEAGVYAAGGRSITCASCQSSQHFTSKCKRYKELCPPDRLAFVKTKRLCWLCLAEGHTCDTCPLPWKCQERSCGGRHHTSLHQAFVQLGASSATGNVNCATGEDGAEVMHSGEVEGVYLTASSVCLPLTPVTLSSGNVQVETYALLDSGSTMTLCSELVSEKLGLVPKATKWVKINSMAGERVSKGNIVDMSVKAIKGGESYLAPISGAMTVDRLPISLDHLARGADLQKFTHLADLPIHEGAAGEVGILIGQNNAHLLEWLEKRKGDSDYKPYGVLTPVGWTVFGNVSADDEDESECVMAIQGRISAEFYDATIGRAEAECHVTAAEESYCCKDDLLEGVPQVDSEQEQLSFEQILAGCERIEDLCEALLRFWEVEDVPEVSRMSRDDQYVYELWEREFRLVDGRPELPIPFKQEPPDFPNNYIIALRCLEALGRRLLKNEDELRQYQAAMNRLFELGFAEVVTEEMKVDLRYLWFLLHHGVKHPRKPGVVRVVKNGGAQFKKRSLNNSAYRGPDMLNGLVKVLTNFRRFRHASQADIEGMFNQMLVPPRQRDAQSFLYWVDGDPRKGVIVCRMRTHVFGTVWAPSAANYTMKRIARELTHDMPPEVRTSIERELYVDDWCNCEDGEDVAATRFRDVRTALGRGHFNLGKLVSNSRRVLGTAEANVRAKEIARIDVTSDHLPKGFTLGQLWDPEEDHFGFKLRLKIGPKTRRGMMSTVAGVYDPMGLVCPFILPAKLLMQQVCVAGSEWDDALPEEVEEQWERWLDDVELINQFVVPRWMGCARDSENRLHNFADASLRAYGGASFLVSGPRGGRSAEREASLIAAKSKVAPRKQNTLTIVRLELAAATVAVKVNLALEDGLDLKLEESQFYSDSKIVLYYLDMDPADLDVYEANRVAFIQKHTRRQQWHYIPSAENPADLVSRGARASELVGNRLWIHGPDRIREDVKPDGDLLLTDEEVAEVKTRKPRPVFAMSVADLEPASDKLYEFFGRYSELNQALKSAAWLLRAKALLRKKEDARAGPLSAADLDDAELCLSIVNQRKMLTAEVLASPGVRRLMPVLKDGVCVVGGRVGNAMLPDRVKHPIVLPASSHLARQVIVAAHRAVAHAGVDRTLQEARKGFWIISGTSVTAGVIRNCVACLRRKGRPVEQRMASLPERRLRLDRPPFASTGVDLFGPLEVIIRRAREKRWGVIFTCMTTRAIYLDLAFDLSSASFLCVMDRFIARRGRPVEMSSDNGTNFVGVKNEKEKVEMVLSGDKVTGYLMEKRIRWFLNTPAASHQGGAWERMIRTVKSLLYCIITEETTTHDKLYTALCVVEAIVNNRPLTRLTEDPERRDVLTPNHLLQLGVGGYLFPVGFTGERLRRDWERAQEIAEEFWRRFIREYLPELQRRTQWNLEGNNLKLGELVMVVKNDVARNRWPLAVVTGLHPGADGLVRNVTLKTSDGTLRRPVQKVVRLEADCG